MSSRHTGPAINFATSDPSLGDIVNLRGIGRVAYFHCDHFEPWRWPLVQGVEDNAAEILRFADVSAANEYSRRLTLFYKAHVGFSRTGRARGGVQATPGDPFMFLPRSTHVEETCRRAMAGLLERVAHEIQVHIHHENYTYNTTHTDPAVLEAFSQPDGRQRDSARLEFALRLGLQAIRYETGLPLDRWFFVHGQWGLNASDPSVCHITDEIAILMRNGALGDFTFPAGRPNVDPPLDEPYLARPVDAPRGYMLPAAEPESAFGNAEAARTKFFIWASPLRHRGTSFDYYSDHVRQDLSKPEEFARRILERSVVADGTLYFKTHAHSMHPNYRRPDGAVVFPHQHPLVRRLMGVVFDAASQAGASVDFLTASEVYDEFTRPRPPPPGGFALTLPVDAGSFSTPSDVLSEGAAPLEHAHELNSTATSMILASLANERAAIGYYEARARHREVLAPYESVIARALLGQPRFDAIVEVGAGIAALTICLALNGARSVGVEKDAHRARIAQSLLERMSATHPEIASLCEIRHAAAPAGLRGIASQNSALVFTNIAGSIPPPDLDELIALAAGFRAVVVDLSRFFEPRDRPAQASLLDRFVLAGWGDHTPISSASDTYWMFRKRATLDPDDA
jgi:predicted O-methyltransferase YrrM